MHNFGMWIVYYITSPCLVHNIIYKWLHECYVEQQDIDYMHMWTLWCLFLIADQYKLPILIDYLQKWWPVVTVIAATYIDN